MWCGKEATAGPRGLKDRVLAAGLCTACGMCVGLCPYIREKAEHVAFVAECSREEGRCYKVCPQTEADLASLRLPLADAPHQDPLLGPHRGVCISRSPRAAVRRKGQYGATVTALLCHALESGRIDAALLTAWPKQGRSLLPEPLVATTQQEILAAAGSKYTAAPSLKLLNLPLPGVDRLAVVGRPCQILAVRKRRLLPDPTFPAEKIVLLIGLFCMWALSYRDLETYLEPHLALGKIRKMDIPKGRCRIDCGSRRIELPHDEIRGMSRAACSTCMDFTAELADLSVGSTEWKAGWNTLIVRSAAGSELVESACDNGWLETRPMKEERVGILREASRTKKSRALGLREQTARIQKGPPGREILEERERAARRND
jgi:coenzyme F420 hydrogenase subunit beta